MWLKERIFSLFVHIISENDVQFEIKLFALKLSEYGVTISYTANHHLQADQIEIVD